MGPSRTRSGVPAPSPGGVRSRIAAVLSLAALATGAAAADAPGAELVVEDFGDVVTSNDVGLNDFSGNTGVVNARAGGTKLVASPGGGRALRLRWSFRGSARFIGIFHSLFGSTLDRRRSLNLDAIDAPLAEPGGPRSVRALRVALRYGGADPLTLRLELKDVRNRARRARFRIRGSTKRRVLTWRFRERGASEVAARSGLDLRRAKELVLAIDQHERGGNPRRGVLDLERIALVTARAEPAPDGDAALLDLAERRACQYFLDWESKDPRSRGIPQDRSTFVDLLTVGGTGFALPAYAICAERGWISRAAARSRVLAVLRRLGDRDSFGPQPRGRVGHRGWLYHLLGPGGRRKDPAVELASIDTALALMGVLAVQSYFDRPAAGEARIRSLAQRIYDAVEWPFMLEPASRQFYLAWIPERRRAGFGVAAPTGSYSGTPADPATLDLYTDEAFILTLLAAGSQTHPVPPDVHCAWRRQEHPLTSGLVASFPGALFTYQFLHAFVDTRTLALPGCPGQPALDPFENSRRAVLAAIGHAEREPRRFRTYGANAWGISAAEGPDDRYRAYGAPPLALDATPDEDGTVTYYAMLSAASFGPDLRARAAQALREARRRGHWHPRFGLPDAFNDEIGEAGLDPVRGNRLLRRRGPWVQRALFAIDQGPMLLHLENQRSGLVWDLMSRNPNIQRALGRLRSEPG